MAGRGLAGVAARQGHGVFCGEGVEAGEEASEPFAVSGSCEDLGRKRKREKGGERRGAHGGEVAEAASEDAMADGFGRMEAAERVATFEGEIRGHEHVVAARRAEDGAVVADAEDDA